MSNRTMKPAGASVVLFRQDFVNHIAGVRLLNLPAERGRP